MRIAAVRAELHIFGGKANFARPLRLAVSFDDGSLVRLRGSGDGEGMIVDRLPLEQPMDMEEYGRTATFDITDRLDRSLGGAAIGGLLAIRNPDGKLTGVALSREGREQFCIWIDGDEFHWGPASALESQDWMAGSEPENRGSIGNLRSRELPYRSPSADDTDLAIFRSWFAAAFACLVIGLELLRARMTIFGALSAMQAPAWSRPLISRLAKIRDPLRRPGLALAQRLPFE